ncbi:hypothetical protein NA57DRAFT_79848 [Rhizodiscina lignyota]|uniref:Uncharacterized protein n=1 Tax=Rhizodiscina lignyota TaxID=1504668 RepID=A0A9P4I877_9PEZI|nr:hypothetical protein NA57DRAFT_79848 [Rhizodiscina lignyota]
MPSILDYCANQKIEVDLEPPSNDEILVPDPDVELGGAERAAKRRRVEEHARQCLKDMPLYIQSAALMGPFDKRWHNPWRKRGGTKETAHGTTQGHRKRRAVEPEIVDSAQSLKDMSYGKVSSTSPEKARYRESTSIGAEGYTNHWLKTRNGGPKSRIFEGMTPERSVEQASKRLVHGEESPSKRTQRTRDQVKIKKEKMRDPLSVAVKSSEEKDSPPTLSNKPQSPAKLRTSSDATSLKLHATTLNNEEAFEAHSIKETLAQTDPKTLPSPKVPGNTSKVLANNVPAVNAIIRQSSQGRLASGEMLSPNKYQGGFTPINKRPDISTEEKTMTSKLISQEPLKAEANKDAQTYSDNEHVHSSFQMEYLHSAERCGDSLRAPVQRSAQLKRSTDVKLYPNSTSSQGFAYRRATDSPPNAGAGEEKNALLKPSQSLPQHRKRRKLSFASTPTVQHKGLSETKLGTATAVPKSDEGIADPITEKQIAHHLNGSIKDTTTLFRKAVRNSTTSLAQQPTSNEAHTETISSRNFGVEVEDPDAERVNDDDFSTQAAILEAQRAFQENISPINCSTHVTSTANGNDSEQCDDLVHDNAPSLTPITPFRAFRTPPRDEAPISTQELLDAAQGLAFSTVKKPQPNRDGKRAGFADNVPHDNADTLVVCDPDSGAADETTSISEIRNAATRSRDASSVQSRKSLRQASALRSSQADRPSVKPSASTVKAASIIASGSTTHRDTILNKGIGAKHRNGPQIVNNYSQDAQRVDKSTMSLDFGIGGDADMDIDAAVNDCSGFLDGWDVESDLKRSMEEAENETKAQSTQKTMTRSRLRKSLR